MTVEDFLLPFCGKLLADNLWVKLAEMMPLDMIEEVYAQGMWAPMPKCSDGVCIILS